MKTNYTIIKYYLVILELYLLYNSDPNDTKLLKLLFAMNQQITFMRPYV